MTPSLEARLRIDLTRVAHTTEIPPAPTLPRAITATPRWARRHRLAVAVTATGAVVLGAVPAAAAAGHLPAIRAAFGWSRTLGPLAARDRTGRLLLTTTGPGGQPMQLYVAATRDGGKCVSLLLPQMRGSRQQVSASCSVPGPFSRLSGLGDSAGPRGEYALFSAPGAARLRLSDRTSTRSLPVVDGLSAAWIPGAGYCGPAYPAGWTRTLTLTSYGPSGSRLGRIRIFAGDPSWLLGSKAGPGGPSTTRCPTT